VILVGHDRDVAVWVAAQLEADLGRIYAAIGLLDQSGALVAGGVLHNWSKYDMELTYCGRLTAEMVRTLDAAVRKAEVARVTVRIARRNRRIARGLAKFGFAWEGIQRRLCGPTRADDGIIYGRMMR
jgi:RimJ/RimL family protein N-acetyltransferase